MCGLAHWRKRCVVPLLAALLAVPLGRFSFGVPPSGGQAGQPVPAPNRLKAELQTPELKTGAPVKFEGGDAVDVLLNGIAARFGVIVVTREPVKAYVLKAGTMPAKLEDAVALARETLDAQGYGIIQTVTPSPHAHIVLKIVTANEAKQAALLESPVTLGVEPAAIDASNPDNPVTHLLPVTHGDMIDSLRRTVTQDKDVNVDVQGTLESGYTLIVSGPAAKVKKAVQAEVAVDKPAESQVAMQMVTLKNINAQATANSLNAGFAANSGLKAVADRRTNTVIVTGPEAQVVQVVVTLMGLDMDRTARPAATAPGRPDAARAGQGK